MGANPGGRSVLRRESATARLQGLRVRIPPGPWMSVSCEWCVLSGRGLCDGLIPRPEETHRVRMRLSVIRRNNSCLHLQWIDRRGQAYKERKKENPGGGVSQLWLVRSNQLRGASPSRESNALSSSQFLYLTTHNTHNSQTSMPTAGFEPAIPASERPQSYALDRAATGIVYASNNVV